MEQENILEKYPGSLKFLNEIHYTIVQTKSPISLLLEICTQLRLPLPTFAYEKLGEPHKLKFQCKIENYQVKEGFGLTKQLSKETSALHMLTNITNLIKETKNSKFCTDLENYM